MRLTLTALVAGLSLIACPLPDIEDLIPDASGLVDASAGHDAAPVFDATIGDLGPTDAGGEVYVDQVSPNTGVITGGYRIRITGMGFNTNTIVRFGDAEADNILLQSSLSLTLRVPAVDQSGPVDVIVDNGASQAIVENGFIYFDALSIDVVTPDTAPTGGGTRVTLDGAGFVGDLLVLCGGRAAAEVSIVSEQQLDFTAPPGPPGLVSIEVLSTYGRAERPLSLRYYLPLELDSLAPASGPLAGGNQVVLHGAGFTRDTLVRLGGAAVLAPYWIDADRLRVTVPPGAGVGAVDVEVEDSYSRAELPGGYAYRAQPSGALRLDAVVPASGDARGGEIVTLVGERLDDGATTVLFDGAPATVLGADGPDHFRVITPAHAPGAVDVTLNNAGGSVTAVAGFTYEERLSVDAIAPARGAATGGTDVTVRGSGFGANTEILLGGGLLVGTVVVDSNTITGQTPPGSAGMVDVEASDPDRGVAKLTQGFLYEDALAVLAVRPIKGAMSGGTFARVYGRGFTAGATPQALFGDAAASQISVESDSLLTLRTPPYMPGVVDVHLVRGVAHATAEQAFTYYDPSFLIGGTRGGAIDGAVYVSCFHAITGMPLEGITVMLGTRPDTPYLTQTDIFGQATLSGPDLRGPQTVTVAATGYESISLVEVNASEITLFMYPTTMTPSSGQPPPMPPPPIISGRLFGFAKELFDPAAMGPNESALAIVETSVRSIFSSSQPPSQSQYVVSEGGFYTIPAARVGRLAVVAVAGIFNSVSQEFRPRQIGFHRGVTAAWGDVLEGIDVELTIPLNTELSIFLPDMPYRPPSPDTAVLMPFLNLGGEGVYPLAQVLDPGANTVVLSDFPDVPGELLTFLAGAFTITYNSLGQMSLSAPYSIVVRDGVGDLRSGITLDPILGFPELVEPVDNGVMTGNRIRWKKAPGTTPSYVEVYLAGFDGIYWDIFVPGHLSKLVIPVFPELEVESPPQNVGLGAYQGWLSAVYMPGFTFDNFSYLDLSTVAWRSWTQDTFKFANGDTP